MIIEGRVGSVDLRIDTEGWPAPTKNMMDGGIASIIQKTPANATLVYLRQVYELLADLPTGLRVLELGAGIGLFPKVIGPTIKPSSWASIDFDPWCKSNFIEPRAEFWLKDFYELSVDELSGYGLIICDYGYTLARYERDPTVFELMADIAEAAPEWWEITDLGYFWSHLHRPQYMKQFGVDIVNKESYTKLFIEKIKEWWNYDFEKMTVGGGAQYYLFRRGK